ncbi:MAG: hypothetical protein HAW63_05070, partial [Bdellovibrionaceae bacterium]|nr:hypothetical protein [Pseudobdellovibrionaceae bacterium]
MKKKALLYFCVALLLSCSNNGQSLVEDISTPSNGKAKESFKDLEGQCSCH